MDTFLQTLGGVVALVFGIIIISLFFWALGRFSRFLDGKKIVRLPGLGQESRLVNVYLIDGSTLGKMKVLGLAQNTARQHAMPHHIAQMLVLEDSQGLKTYLKSDSIKMIQELSSD